MLLIMRRLRCCAECMIASGKHFAYSTVCRSTAYIRPKRQLKCLTCQPVKSAICTLKLLLRVPGLRCRPPIVIAEQLQRGHHRLACC